MASSSCIKDNDTFKNETFEIDTSKAGQCVDLATKEYYYYPPGTMMLVEFQFITEENFQLPLKIYPDGKNGKHAVLLHRPSEHLESWKIVDACYVKENQLLDFKTYILKLSKHYKGDINAVRFSWKLSGIYHNIWLGKPGTFTIKMSEIKN